MTISFDLVKAAILVHGEDLASYPHVLKVEPGLAFTGGRTSGEPAVVVKVDRKVPSATLLARDIVPTRLGRVRVDVRQATAEEQLELLPRRRPEAEAVTPTHAIEHLASGLGIVDMRTPVERESSSIVEAELVPYEPPTFFLTPVDADMSVVCHASPDAGWKELRAFLAAPASHLSATIFEFNATHIRDALLTACGATGRMKFVMHFKNLSGFDNLEAEQDLRARLGDRLAFAWAAVAQTSAVTEGWFPSAYHIKTIVKDHRHLWLSSGNWKSSSQPVEDPFGGPAGFDAAAFLRNRNREWHVVIDSPELASQFESFIEYDLDKAKAVQSGSAPQVEPPDVFVPTTEPFAPEAEPEFFQPLRVNRRLRVTPLLSPDNFVDEITALVTRATHRLYIQNQYLKPTRLARWRELNEFVAEFSRRPGVDFRVILRPDVRDSLEMMAEMGFDLTNVRQIKNTHTKGILVDDLGVVIGSHNWSGDGFLRNRDASLIFDDQEIIDYLERLFLFDWSRAVPAHLPSPEAEAVLAPPGEPTPAGMRRVSSSEFESE